MKTPIKKAAPLALPLLAAAAAVATLAVGRTVAAPAASTVHHAASAKATDKDAAEKEDGDKDAEEKEDGDEDKAPTVKADITPQAAQAAALKAKPGKAGEVELESEKGRAVYSVDVTAAGGQKFEVKVDGHSGRVLSTEVDNDKDEKEGGTDDEDDAKGEAKGK